MKKNEIVEKVYNSKDDELLSKALEEYVKKCEFEVEAARLQQKVLSLRSEIKSKAQKVSESDIRLRTLLNGLVSSRKKVLGRT